jgi:nucleoside-diphosphate-sugar epimerase
MNLSTKKILVTGADGFIGSHFTEMLLSMGCHVRALRLYNSFNAGRSVGKCPVAV